MWLAFLSTATSFVTGAAGASAMVLPLDCAAVVNRPDRNDATMYRTPVPSQVSTAATDSVLWSRHGRQDRRAEEVARAVSFPFHVGRSRQAGGRAPLGA